MCYTIYCCGHKFAWPAVDLFRFLVHGVEFRKLIQTASFSSMLLERIFYFLRESPQREMSFMAWRCVSNAFDIGLLEAAKGIIVELCTYLIHQAAIQDKMIRKGLAAFLLNTSISVSKIDSNESRTRIHCLLVKSAVQLLETEGDQQIVDTLLSCIGAALDQFPISKELLDKLFSCEAFKLSQSPVSSSLRAALHP